MIRRGWSRCFGAQAPRAAATPERAQPGPLGLPPTSSCEAFVDTSGWFLIPLSPSRGWVPIPPPLQRPEFQLPRFGAPALAQTPQRSRQHPRSGSQGPTYQGQAQQRTKPMQGAGGSSLHPDRWSGLKRDIWVIGPS